MGRVWQGAKVAVLVAAAYCIFSPGGRALRGVRAEGEGCDTTVACSRNSSGNACYCRNATTGGKGCEGCYVGNNEAGCGSCSAGPPVLE